MENINRLKFLRITICLGLLAGIAFSHELWFPINRTFPRAPFLFALPESFVLYFEWLFSSISVISLTSIIFSRRPKTFFVAAVSSLVLLIFFDQTRLQPWIYQYLLLLVILSLHDWKSEKDEADANQILCFVQIIIAGLYFWSGVQKLNFSFSAEIVPLLLAPVQNIFSAVRLPFFLLGLSAAMIEAAIGCGLLFRRTRNAAVFFAVALHAVILILLIAEDYNRIVWIWNAALAAMVVAAFRQSDVSFKGAFRKAGDLKTATAKIIAVAAVLLPVLSFWGLWDMYLSGALYSGNVEIAVVKIAEDTIGKLPPKAQKAVFQIKSGGSVLPLFEWSMAELSVPVYPERRVFKQAARQVCKTTSDAGETELIIKERPAIFDGSYKVTRLNCEQLKR